MKGWTASRRAVGTWLAAWAVLFSALAPAASSLLAYYGIADGQWLVDATQRPVARSVFDIASICHAVAPSGEETDGSPATAASVHPAVLATADQDGARSHDGHRAGLHLNHCLFCGTHAGSFGLLPQAGVLVPAVAAASLLPVLLLQARRPLFAWLAPPSRGPPVRSGF